MKIQLEIVFYTVAEKAALEAARRRRINKTLAALAVVILLAPLTWAALRTTYSPSPLVSQPTPTSQSMPAYGIMDFDAYYQCECRKPNGFTVARWLSSLNLVDIYKENGFDCSQMSAYVEWLLDNCGYDAQIAADDDELHTWVVFDYAGSQRIYETTSDQMFPDSYNKRRDQWGQDVADLYARPEHEFYTIHDIYHWSRDKYGESAGLVHFTMEWAWWENLPLVAAEFYTPPKEIK